MPTRTQVLVPIVIAAAIIGIAGMLTIPTDVKLESVEFPRVQSSLMIKSWRYKLQIPTH